MLREDKPGSLQLKSEGAETIPSEALQAYEQAREFFNRSLDQELELRRQRKMGDYNRLVREVNVVSRFFPLLFEEVLEERRNRSSEPQRRRRLSDMQSE